VYRKGLIFIVNNKQIEAFPEIDDFLLKKMDRGGERQGRGF
jgi:hypothetical protein